MLITDRAELVGLLRQMAEPNWLGGAMARMTIAKNAADVIELLGESVDDTQRSLSGLHVKLDELANRLGVKTPT